MLTKNNSETIQTKCEMCHGTLIFDVHADERVCNGCGVVIPICDEFLHNSTCAQIKNNDLQPVVESLTNNMMYDISLPTFIGQRDVDASGKQIKSSHLDRMRKLDRITLSNDNKMRNLNKAIREIRRITEILGLKTLVAERATYIYRKAFGLGLIRGRSISGIAAAAIFVACKELNIPHSVYDIEKMIDGLSKKNVLRYHKILLKVMKINLGVPTPTAHVSKIAERAGLSGKIERRTLEILSKVSTNQLLAGKKPISIAAAALYLASIQTKERTTQLRIAIATDLTTITIRKRCNEITQILDEIKMEEMKKTDKEELQPRKDLVCKVPVLIEQAP